MVTEVSKPMSDQLVRPGKFVSVTYSMGDEAGNVVEQSDLPVSYIHGGSTELIGGMDQALAGKGVGDMVELQLPAEAAFGHHDPNLTFTDDLANVPPEFRHLGAEVQMQNDAGDIKSFYVTRIEGGRLTVDGNHPLAGKALHVKVTVREVRDPTPAELAQDRAGSASTGIH
jgi:FKBP-type peptidyl-prolyl cis-trans isomerase SlyD